MAETYENEAADPAAADDQDAGPTATEELVDQEPARDQAEGEDEQV